ncbi:hypothetical protein [Sphingomonas sp. YL-JM2C]
MRSFVFSPPRWWLRPFWCNRRLAIIEEGLFEGARKMAEFLTLHGTEILSAIAGLFAGAAISIPITVRVTQNSMDGESARSNQSGASAGGDIVGRDKITR